MAEKEKSPASQQDATREGRVQEMNKMFQRVSEAKGVEAAEVKAPEKAEKAEKTATPVDRQTTDMRESAGKAETDFSERISDFKARSEEFKATAREALETAAAVSTDAQANKLAEHRELSAEHAALRDGFAEKWEKKFDGLKESRQKDNDLFAESMHKEMDRLLQMQEKQFNNFIAREEKLLLAIPPERLDQEIRTAVNTYAKIEGDFERAQAGLIGKFRTQQQELQTKHEAAHLHAIGEFSSESMRMLSEHGAEFKRFELKSRGAGADEVEMSEVVHQATREIIDSYCYIARHAESKGEVLGAESYAKGLMAIIEAGVVKPEQEAEFDRLGKGLSELKQSVANRVETEERREAEMQRQEEARARILPVIEASLAEVKAKAEGAGQSFNPDFFKSMHMDDVVTELVKYKEPEKLWAAALKMADHAVLEKGTVDYTSFFNVELAENLLGSDIRFMANNGLFSIAYVEAPEFFDKKIEAAFPKAGGELRDYMLGKYPHFGESAPENFEVKITDLNSLGGGRGRIGAMIAEVQVFSNGELLQRENVIIKEMSDEIRAGIGLKKTVAGSVEKTVLDMLKVIYPERYSEYTTKPCDGYMVMSIVKGEDGKPAKTYSDYIANKEEAKKLTMGDLLLDGNGIGESIALTCIGIGDRHGANAMPVGSERTRIEIDFGESFHASSFYDSIEKIHSIYNEYAARVLELKEEAWNQQTKDMGRTERDEFMIKNRESHQNEAQEAMDKFKASVEEGFNSAFKRIQENREGVVKVLNNARESQRLINENGLEVTADDLDKLMKKVNTQNPGDLVSLTGFRSW